MAAGNQVAITRATAACAEKTRVHVGIWLPFLVFTYFLREKIVDPNVGNGT